MNTTSFKMKRCDFNQLSAGQQAQVLSRPALAADDDIKQTVRTIIQNVRKKGDDALREYAQLYDRVALDMLAVTPEEFDTANRLVTKEAAAAMAKAFEQITRFHQAGAPRDFTLEVSEGVVCGVKIRPLSRVGLYIPSGTAPLPSTVLMLGVPALLAGCPLRIICTPPRIDGTIDPNILYAAKMVGITQVYKTGGAGAVAAMAYGTASIPKVDKIYGPGNAWVTAAKVQVALDPAGAGCDMPAGPSEVMVLADESADPAFVAADLLSQAEHGVDSHCLLVTTSTTMLDQVETALMRQLSELPRYAIASVALKNSVFITVASRAGAAEVANAYAPEHLIIQMHYPQEILAGIMHAGSVFLGPYSPESMGDYLSGTNHVLPTYGFARSISGLSVKDFVKQMTFQEVTKAGIIALGPYVETLAMLEGLAAHARAVTIRLNQLREEGSAV